MNFELYDNWSYFPEYAELGLKWAKCASIVSGFAFEAVFCGRIFKLRLNDFPEEPLYTLIVDGKEIINFNDWPSKWRRI